MKERWNYEKFIEAYNKLAKNKGGQEFNENILPEKIEQSYVRSSRRSIEEFVENYFLYRQESQYTKHKEERTYQKNGNDNLV